jgi:hypothetical protein
MRFFVLFLCLFFTFSAFAQKDREPRVLFKLAPLALIDDFSFAAIQGGVEVALSDRMSWFNEFGFRYRNGLIDNGDTSFVKPGGFKIKSELRYYLKDWNDNAGRLTGYYLAVNLFYLKNTRNAYVGYYNKQDTTKATTSDDFGMTRKVWGGNLIIGKQMALGKRFMFEYYGGLGVRIRNIVTVAREFDAERHREHHAHDASFMDLAGQKPELKDGKTGTINISLGIRVAYRLY